MRHLSSRQRFFETACLHYQFADTLCRGSQTFTVHVSLESLAASRTDGTALSKTFAPIRFVGKDRHVMIHFHIVAAVYLLPHRRDCPPVGHCNSVESPFLAQNSVDDSPVRGGRQAVDEIVTCHHSPRLAVFHGAFESAKIYFPKCAFRDDGTGYESSRLAVVAAKMF